MIIILIVTFVLVSCDCYNLNLVPREKRQAASLTELDPDIIKQIDKEARRQIVFLIVDRLNDTIHSHFVLIQNCEKKLNETIQNCSFCQGCPSQLALTTAFLDTLSNKIRTNIHVPITYAGEFVRTIAESTLESRSFLGDRWGEFTKAVGGNLIEIGNILGKGGHETFASAVNAFKSLGQKFKIAGEDIVNSLKGVVGNTVNDITSTIVNAFADFDNKMKEIGSKISDGSTVKDTIKTAVTTIWDKTFGRFLRRKRTINHCEQQCSSCEQLRNASAHIVCGASTTKQRKDAINEITFLIDLYNMTTQAEQVTSIEYDNASSLFDGGFTQSFFTWGTNRQELIAGMLNVTSPKKTGQAIAQQYFATELSKLQTDTST